MLFKSKNKFNIDELKFDKMNGVLPVAVIDHRNNNLLMLSFMNREALEKTIVKRVATFYSRTQKSLWTKGSVSGEFLNVIEIKHDCDKDALMISVIPKGNACHKGTYSCFGDEVMTTSNYLYDLFALVKSRKKEMPEGSYTTNLFKSGKDKIVKRFGEKSIDSLLALKDGKKEKIIDEVSDMIYHLFVLLASEKIELSEIVDHLEKTHKLMKDKPDPETNTTS